jgi:hypothetical protein
MPKKGHDKAFDRFLVELKLDTNRRYASAQWRQFRANRGIYPPPSFECNEAKLRVEITGRVAKFMRKIMENQLAWIESFDMKQHMMDKERLTLIKTICKATFVQELITVHIQQLTELLVMTLAGAGNRSIDTRVFQMEIQMRRKLRSSFVSDIRQQHGLPQEHTGDRIFLNELHVFVVSQWETAISLWGCKDFVSDLDDDIVETVLMGSLETLYYVSGYLLLLICRVPQTEEGTSASKWFVSVNSVAGQVAKSSAKLLTNKVAWKDTGDNLQYSNVKWFSFVSLLEALYVVNLTPSNSMRHRSRLLE